MKVFVDFADAILTNSLSLEQFFISLRKYGFNCCKKIKTAHLTSLPYNSKTLSVLKENYDSPISTIVFVYKPEDKDYAEMGKMQLKEHFHKIELLEIRNNNKLATISAVEKDFKYIGGSIFDWSIYKKAAESSIIANIASNILHLIICNKSKDSRVNLVDGFFFIFFKYMQIIFPIFAIWPSWMEIDSNIINLTKISAIFISSLGFFSFMGLLRTLISLDVERCYFQQEKEPLCGYEFITGGAKLKTAIMILCIFFCFGAYGFFVHPFGGLIGFVLSLVYFVVCLSTFWFRWSVMISACVGINLLANLVFAQKLFKIL